MAEFDTVPQHRHCFTCGKAHTEEGRFCGDACMSVRKEELKKKKRQLLIIEVLAVAMMVVAIILIM
jgi:predicted nucleic acid-binding Zn ribbon protein